MTRKKLVIFDIDGTLIRTARLVDNLQRFRYAVKKVFGIDIGSVTETLWKEKSYNGKGDRYILWDMVKGRGVSRDAFLDRIGEVGDAFSEYLESIKSGGPSYTVIPEAKRMLEKVIEAPHLSEGVLTGNLGPAAIWKLKAAGLPDIAFGVFGHEADERNDLSRLLLSKASAYYGYTVSPRDVIIVGDTIHDVNCAKAINAQSIIVSTGWNVSREEIQKADPDLLVDSLLDPSVLTLLGLK